MKKGWKIFIIVLVCIILLASFIIYKNWNTVLGVIDGFRYSQEDVERRQEENKKELQKFLDENENVTVRDLTDEENEALANGEIDHDDAVQIITGQKTLEDAKEDKIKSEAATQEPDKKPESETTSDIKPDEQGSVTNSTSTETKSDNQTAVNNQTTAEKKPESNEQQPSMTQPDVKAPQDASAVNTEGKTSDQIVSELIATLYVQKSIYLSSLDGLEASLGAEFEKLPLEEKRKQKPKIIAKYMPIIAQWEKNCDSVVYGILDQIEAELKKSGKDTSIVTKIDEAYQNEKRLKKAYYINNYMS